MNATYETLVTAASPMRDTALDKSVGQKKKRPDSGKLICRPAPS
jgi:hypothetical protein